MHRKILGFAAILALCGWIAGCGGHTDRNSGSGSGSGGVPVVVTMHDAAPTGVTVLNFSITVSSLTLQGSGTTTANLLSSPVTVQFQNLLTQSTLLADASATAGTYSSMMITFASPSITIINGSASAITVGTTTCAVGQTCTLSPTLNTASDTISTSPFPLSLTSGTPVNLSIDFNVASSLQSNLSVTPSVSVSSPAAVSGNLQTLSSTGQVTSLGSNTVTVTDAATGTARTFSTTGATFNGFTANGTSCVTANTAACLAANQNVAVNFNVSQSNPSTLTATGVTLENGITNGVTGTVVAVNSAQNQFTMIVTGTSPSRTGVTAGQKLVVTVPTTSSSFGVLPNGTLTTPSGLNFNGASSVVVGQTVTIDSSNLSTTNGTATASQVLLMPSQFTGNVSAVNGSNVTVNGLNGVFTGGNTNSVVVNTQPGTVFTGVTGTSGLTLNQPVTVGGTLFNNGTGTTVVGGQVVQ